MKRNTMSDDTITVFALNVRSIWKHTDDIVSDDKITWQLFDIQKHNLMQIDYLENNRKTEFLQY